MNHSIMGVVPNEDFASFEEALPLSTQELMEIMGWEKLQDCVFDYLLTVEQVSKIEDATGQKSPLTLIYFSPHTNKLAKEH
ncbi:hypothetical protein HF257_31590 [Pseudomonas sp. WS 5106]|uniref:Uncharacterized protein n=1 Tax=Pseudomonas cremoris TaxID=2724178 RepID=A0A7X1AUE7_9PSED|nr:hypothetical protein [Pseudomonas cremoris]MBC2384837.1 hypothetical protein [Pseudomonas cremoris]MBC2410577.1 hypothetical protein [Pseudomonas cremoris]